MSETPQKDDKVIVLGRNRPRLTKIMSLLRDEECGNDNSHQPSVEYVPCLAAMDSYQDESGATIPYLAQMVHMKDSGETSSMTDLLDDDDFRNFLKCVIMVGYEWHPDNQPHIEKYFAMYQQPMDGADDDIDDNCIKVVCVQPNEEYGSLQEEMDAFKALGDDRKAEATANGTMGPGKMARFVREAYAKVVVGNSGTLGDMEDIKESGEMIEEAVAATDDPSSLGEPTFTPRLYIDPNKPMFACRMCRTILFGEDHLADNHVQSQHAFRKFHHNKNKKPQQTCQSLFCDDAVLPQFHSDTDHSDMEGRLQCPHCDHKLGHWNWSGAQCSCGTWVVPAIQIPLSKVDTIQPQTQQTNDNGSGNAAVGATTMVSPVITPILPR
ncbi:MAG: hypothetical protein SGILL_005971 [Bacillariaceae sp.]